MWWDLHIHGHPNAVAIKRGGGMRRYFSRNSTFFSSHLPLRQGWYTFRRMSQFVNFLVPGIPALPPGLAPTAFKANSTYHISEWPETRICIIKHHLLTDIAHPGGKCLKYDKSSSPPSLFQLPEPFLESSQLTIPTYPKRFG